MKSELTLQLERNIWRATSKQGVFGCYEVTIGWFGHERVDYMTYDTSGIFRCYELKVSKSDFHSTAAVTFAGHFNYYVLPRALYEQVKDEIPGDVGVYCDATRHNGEPIPDGPCVCVKKAKRRPLTADVQVLKDSMIRSLCRDVGKQIASGNPTLIEYYKRELAEKKRDADYWYKQYQSVMGAVVRRYGEDWDAGPVEEAASG